VSSHNLVKGSANPVVEHKGNGMRPRLFSTLIRALSAGSVAMRFRGHASHLGCGPFFAAERPKTALGVT
jgi:hypothetical protein